MHFTCRSFIGKNNSQNWSQYWENEPDDQLKFSHGHLFGIVNVQSDDHQSPNNIGHDLIFKINQTFFSSDSQKNIEINLKKTLESVTQDPDFLNYQLEIILLVILNNQAFAATFNSGQVIIQRNSQISLILNGQTNEISSVSGPIKDCDRFFIASHQFFEKITWDKIKSVLTDTKIQNIEENFLSLLYSFEDQDQSIAAIIEIHQEPEPISEPIETSPVTPSLPIITPPDNQPIFANHLPKTKISQRKKIQIFIAILLIIALFISSLFGYRKNQANQKETNFQNLKSELDKKINNISLVKNLNITTANQTAKEAQEIINQMAKLNIHSDQVSQFRSQIESVLSQTGDSQYAAAENIYDTSLITNKPSFSRLLFFKQNLYLLDSSNGRLDLVDPKNKSTKNIIISDSLKSSQKVLVDNNIFYIFNNNQLSLIDKDKLVSKINFSDNSSVAITDLQFWNGSLYVVDNSHQSIWKFTPNSSGFSEPQNWLKDNTKLELGAKSIAIDGKVWVLSENGQITPYLSGVKDNFKSSQTINFNQTNFLNTNADTDYLAFSDNAKIIFVYQKNGQLISKFNLEKYQIIDLAIDSTDKIIYFLGQDQKIYKINL